jgi:hypothetical protein
MNNVAVILLIWPGSGWKERPNSYYLNKSIVPKEPKFLKYIITHSESRGGVVGCGTKLQAVLPCVASNTGLGTIGIAITRLRNGNLFSLPLLPYALT